MNRRPHRVETRYSTAVMLLAGPVIWFACFLVVYLVTGTGCTFGYASRSIAGISILRLLALSAAVLGALAVGWMLLGTWRRWQETRRLVIDAVELDERQRAEFVQVASFVLCLTSLTGILWLAATIVMNPVC